MNFDALPYGALDRITVGAKGGCWLWAGAFSSGGYGHYRNKSAHRVVYEALVGPIPQGLDLDHLCRVRACVNPRHLEPVTRQENLRRSPLVGKFKPRKAVCQRGHAMVDGNLKISRNGDRRCRTCHCANRRRWWAERQRASA